MVNSFIEIKKSDLKRKLKNLNIRTKYHDAICNTLKKTLEDKLDNFLELSIINEKMRKNWQLTDFYMGEAKSKR